MMKLWSLLIAMIKHNTTYLNSRNEMVLLVSTEWPTIKKGDGIYKTWSLINYIGAHEVFCVDESVMNCILDKEYKCLIPS
jgi:hypothetical protein